MKIQYLGTAAAEGWPALFCHCRCCTEATRLGGKDLRTRSQAVIDDTLLVDFPPDTYHHMLQYGVRLPDIQHILVTHSHEDHFYPLDLTMRRRGCCDDDLPPLHIYGNDKVEALFRRTMAEMPAGTELETRLQFHRVENFVPFEAGGYTVTPMTARHAKNENCLIYLIEKDGKRLLYGNDTGIFPEETFAFLAGKQLDLVSLDSTMLRHKEGTNHMGLEDNALVRQQLETLGCLHAGTRYVITHFSHNGGLLHHEIEPRAQEIGFQVAYDGMSVEF